MYRVRREQADRSKRYTRQRQQARYPGQCNHAGDNGRRRQHDTNLKCGRGDLIVMVSRHRKVALFLGVLGACRQLLRPFAGLRLGAVARGGLLLFVDLFLQRRLGAIVAHEAEA